MRESRLSGSVEGVVCKHNSYSDYLRRILLCAVRLDRAVDCGNSRLVAGMCQPVFDFSGCMMDFDKSDEDTE